MTNVVVLNVAKYTASRAVEAVVIAAITALLCVLNVGTQKSSKRKEVKHMHGIIIIGGETPHAKLIDIRGEYTGTFEVSLPRTKHGVEFTRMSNVIKEIIEHSTNLKFSGGRKDTTHIGDTRIRFYGI